MDNGMCLSTTKHEPEQWGHSWLDKVVLLDEAHRACSGSEQGFKYWVYWVLASEMGLAAAESGRSLPCPQPFALVVVQT